MSSHACPWWLGYLLASPVRRLFENPAARLAPYVREGMLVLEPGPGMGFFTLELARMVGETGRVVAVDLQEKMLAALRRPARVLFFDVEPNPAASRDIRLKGNFELAP